MKTLAVIAARGGSKGVPRKNLRNLGDCPLMDYTVQAARSATRIDRLIVSTEDAEIADLARLLGVEVPFTRPRDLAFDETPLHPVILHALDYFSQEEGVDYDAVVSLDITAPFKLPKDIDSCIGAMESGATSAATVCVAEISPHMSMFTADPEMWGTPLFDEYHTIKRRQDIPLVYRENGMVQAVHSEEIRRGHWPITDRCRLVVTSQARSVVIDSEADYQLAGRLVDEFLAGRLE